MGYANLVTRNVADMALVTDSLRVRDLLENTADPAPAPPVVVAPAAPQPDHPQLFLYETYRLSVFRGDIIRDEQVSAGPQLAPGASQTVRIVTRLRTTEETQQTATVLDMQTSQSQQAFNQSLNSSADEKYGTENYDYGMHGHFHGEGSVGFGSVEGDAAVDVAGGTNDVRQEFASSVGHALNQQVSSANSARREQSFVGSSSQSMEAEHFSTSDSVVENHTDHTQNYGIFQVKEEIVSIVSLVDAMVLFANSMGRRPAPLYNLRQLLSDVIATDVGRTKIYDQVRDVLEHVRDYNGDPRSILRMDPVTGSIAIDKHVTQTYALKDAAGNLRRTLEAPGVILAVYTHYLKKPGVTVMLPLHAM